VFKNVSCLLKDYLVFSIVDAESEIDRLRIIKRVHVCGEHCSISVLIVLTC